MRDKKQLVYIEAMRILATFFVIFNHTGRNGFFLFSTYTPKTLHFWIYLFCAVFCKFAVPLFFAISGALLLGNYEESIRDVWRKRIVRIFAVLIIFSFVYYVRQIHLENKAFDLLEFVVQLYKSNVIVPFWYLYAFLAFLISLPLLRVFVQRLEWKHYYYIIGLALFFDGILPIIEYLLWKGNCSINGNMRVSWILSNIVLYPCLGYYVENKLDLHVIDGKKFLMLWGINLTCIVFSCYMTYYKIIITGECSEKASQTFLGSFTMINFMIIYVSVKIIFQWFRLSDRWNRIISSVGNNTFGIYLLHIGIMQSSLFNNLWVVLHVELHVNYMLSAFLFCFLVMVVGYWATLFLKQIPILKKII